VAGPTLGCRHSADASEIRVLRRRENRLDRLETNDREIKKFILFTILVLLGESDGVLARWRIVCRKAKE
jgi:hypothetical protein